MRTLGLATVIAFLTGPVYAQSTPNINLIPELQSKSPEEKEADQVREKAYQESLKKIPNGQNASDPWGTVRSVDTPRTSAPGKSKTGGTANGNALRGIH